MGIAGMNPITFGLTDRATGTVYYIVAKDGNLALSAKPQRRAHTLVFPAKKGPLLGATNVRLLVRDGRLGYEVVAPDPHPSTLPPLAPYDALHARVNYRLKLPVGFTGTEALAYEITNV